MTELALKFEGICTHLVATHNQDAPQFKLWTGDQLRVRHRVFLANSGLIGSHIPEDRRPRVPVHVPKLLIPAGQVNEDLAELFDPVDDQNAAWRPQDVAIGFEGVDETKGDASHGDSLRELPHIWFRAKLDGALRERVKQGWTRFATAYVDFTEGVEFWTEKPDKMVEAYGTLHFDGPPVLVVRKFNSGVGVRYSLAGVTSLTISNQPEISSCAENDYLLHYFATDLDLLKKAPTWETPGYERSEVYCSSSQYP